jgi:hypothetical protein
MKTLLILSILIFAFHLGAAGQAGIGIDLYGGGGFSIPTEDLNDFWNTGYNLSAAVGYKLLPPLETAARFTYHRLPLAGDASGDKDFTMKEYGIDLRAEIATPTAAARPYVLIGLGAIKYEFSTETVGVEDLPGRVLGGLEPKTKFYYCFGAGIKNKVFLKTSFFLELRYMKMTASNGKLDFLPVTIGLNISL